MRAAAGARRRSSYFAAFAAEEAEMEAGPARSGELAPEEDVPPALQRDPASAALFRILAPHFRREHGRAPREADA